MSPNLEKFFLDTERQTNTFFCKYRLISELNEHPINKTWIFMFSP